LHIEDADIFIAGKTNYEWFGYDALCTKDHILVVGAPGVRDAAGEQAVGAVFGFNTVDKSLIFYLNSTDDQSKFGQHI
jgi:hypothetical protein